MGDHAAEGRFKSRLLSDRGWSHYEARLRKEAIHDFGQAISLDPAEPEFRLGRGMSHGALGHVSVALEDRGEAIKLNPRYARGYAIRGWFLNDFGRQHSAIDD